jgi:hypothetical protein
MPAFSLPMGVEGESEWLVSHMMMGDEDLLEKKAQSEAAATRGAKPP